MVVRMFNDIRSCWSSLPLQHICTRHSVALQCRLAPSRLICPAGGAAAAAASAAGPSLGLDPVDVLLLMAASENDLPKVEELLAAGADISVKDSNNKTPLELAAKEEVVAAIKAAQK